MGGGEKVLYKMLEALFEDRPYLEEIMDRKCHVAIYVDSEAAPREILARAKTRFNIRIPEDQIKFVYITRGKYLGQDYFKQFTLLMQGLSSWLIILEALVKYPTDLLIDSMGFGWIYPIAKLVCPQTRIASYSHYPFISSDMIGRVQSNVQDYNNSAAISQSPFKSNLKFLYYKFILAMYRWMGRFVDLLMTNSTWTYNHFAALWGLGDETMCKL
eukprot:TRINITY_DN5237_c0_g3_i1.p2 TRINITY_DN5237_c0_g3~~TRINITY_DN5237_c0_g3_i1.p2  ORF type:complete len:215 (+),score=53.67 TRINITY_DN5237_c0_g3_i1:374-1018(+)